jgi:ComF family protein
VVNVLPQLVHFQRVALDLLFPPYCIGCGKEGDYFCGLCARDLPYIYPPFCSVCGRPLNADSACPGCISKDHAVDSIRAPFLFNGLIRRAIHNVKYHNLRALAPRLALYLHEYLTQNPLPGDVLVPVPIHTKRRRERGYNQAALITRELGHLNGMPAVDDCLVRLTYLTPQARLSNAVERLQNTAGAFACRDTRLQSKRVILIDDVSTTGATMNACAAALKAAGAAEVRGLVLALEL